MTNMRSLPPRTRLAWFIASYHLGLIITSSIYYIFKGFLEEEFTILMGILTPISALYAGTVFKYIAKSLKRSFETNNGSDDIQVGHIHRLVLVHFAIILFLISSKALFNWINFSTMIKLLSFFEAVFGGYIAYILSAVFGGEKDD